MMAIICFDLVPEAIGMAGLVNTIIGTLCGVIIMLFCDSFIKKRHTKAGNNSLLNTGIIVGIGLALHNFPEGLVRIRSINQTRILISNCYFAS